MNMNPVLANQLFVEGGVFIVTGLPIGTELGIDMCAHIVGENFRGIKMIPPGPHFIWCAAKGPFGDTGPRVGFIHFFKCSEIIVREWDNSCEELCDRKVANPELEKKNIRDNLRELDRFLAPYDYRYVNAWKRLTDTITESIVNRCRPALGGIIRTNIELQSCPDSERPRGIQKPARRSTAIVCESDLLPYLKPIDGTAPRFTSLPDRVPKNAAPTDITRHSLDCFDAINTLIDSIGNLNELSEEIQLSFIFFLIGHSVESLAHWRKILNLLAHSETAVSKYKLLYMKYSEVLSYQLPHLPEELMEPTEHNTVYKDVRSLLQNLIFGRLHSSAELLSKKIQKSMHWVYEGLDDDDPEDMPVVVESV